jgi:hypothetical protein
MIDPARGDLASEPRWLKQLAKSRINRENQGERLIAVEPLTKQRPPLVGTKRAAPRRRAWHTTQRHQSFASLIELLRQTENGVKHHFDVQASCKRAFGF